jgi:protein ImuA
LPAGGESIEQRANKSASFAISMPIRQASPSSQQPTALIERLRQKLSAAEQASGLIPECGAAVELGIAAIDAALAGGLACGALHEIAAARESEASGATGFALAVTVRFLSANPRRAVLWIAEELSFWKNGVPYGPGLDAAGIAPERLIVVTAPRTRDVLWAMEEALRCHAVGVVIGEIGARGIDQVATRRLSLAAAAGNTLGLLLRTTPDDAPCAFATRWMIGAAPSFLLSSSERGRGIGPPRMAVRLIRNRRGQLGAWIVEWNSVEQRLELATHPELMARSAFDRPHRTAAG